MFREKKGTRLPIKGWVCSWAFAHLIYINRDLRLRLTSSLLNEVFWDLLLIRGDVVKRGR